MNILLWILQIVTAVLFTASGVMKVFMFDKVTADVPSFGALPRNVWTMLGIIELISVVGLILPAVTRWHPALTVAAASVLAAETLVFIWVHIRYREVGPMIFSGALGLTMVFIAYGRSVLAPF
jgi:uncharacterized membrane protein YphA (DoxX/SURF4 family)